PHEDAYQEALNEGHSAAWDQDWTKAAACYRRALHEKPEQPNALNSLGLALYQLGDFEEALRTYKHVARLSPDSPVALEKVAQISERLGDVHVAIEASMRAGELFLEQRDLDKAVENWTRVAALRSDHVLAHSRLAMAYETLGRSQQAVVEYLAVASLLQRAGNASEAQQVVYKALNLAPESAEVRQADALLKTGQLLPQPLRTKGGTGPLRMAKIKELHEPTEPARASASLDPVAEASQKALTKLADILFDYTDPTPAGEERRGLAAIVKGTGRLSMQHAEQAKAVLHLGQAIDAQTKGDETTAANELERALDAGFDHAALHFDLGYLRSNTERQESAIRHLAQAAQHRDFGLAARLLQGEILFKRGAFRDASLEYLEALRAADAATAPEDQAEDIRELYEPFIEAQASQKDNEASSHLCENVRGLLRRPDWREQIQQARLQMHPMDGEVAPLAEVMLEAQSAGVIESMSRVQQWARQGKMRPAMDEAYDAVRQSPFYLPLHNLMADVLIQDNRVPEAIAKLSVVARAYSVRGEVGHATKLLRRIIQLSPTDMSARTRLIDLLVARGQVEEAISEYLELAEIYYRLAELDMARKTYTTALRVIQQTNTGRSWNVHILQRMADIDMQRLDWRQAARVYEQIRTLRPDDQAARKQLVELYSRLGQTQLVTAELESFLTYLESNGKMEQSVPFLKELAQEHKDEPLFQRALAAQLHRVGRTREAVSELDDLGEALLQAGRGQEAADVITQIVAMDPPNAAEYRRLLAQIARTPTA
ncbi:MAG: tetratricopeptide repeat protein, partial [Anaerolineales bacterium]